MNYRYGSPINEGKVKTVHFLNNISMLRSFDFSRAGRLLLRNAKYSWRLKEPCVHTVHSSVKYVLGGTCTDWDSEFLLSSWCSRYMNNDGGHVHVGVKCICIHVHFCFCVVVLAMTCMWQSEESLPYMSVLTFHLVWDKVFVWRDVLESEELYSKCTADRILSRPTNVHLVGSHFAELQEQLTIG